MAPIMPDELPSSKAASEPSDVRFSVRGLLIVMVPVAIASALLGPYFRNIPPEERGRIAMLWGLGLVVALAQLVRFARSRFQIEKVAGGKFFALPRRDKFFLSVGGPGVTLVGGFVIIALGLLYLVLRGHGSVPARRSSGMFYELVFPALICGTLIARGIMLIWWQRMVQLRANGLLNGLQFLPWSHVTGHRVERQNWIVEGVDHRQVDTQFMFGVPADQAASVAALLTEKISPRVRDTSQPLGIAPTSVQLPKINIAPQQNVTLRGFFAILFFYIAVIVMVVMFPLGSLPGEFFIGVGIGWAVTIAGYAYRARRAGSAGPLLIRLSERLNLLAVFGLPVVLAAIFYASQLRLYAMPIVAGLVGCGSGMAIFVLVARLLQGRFDLCENGVVLARQVFYAWPEVQLKKWERGQKGKLVLKCGWRRVAALVKAEQCDAVEVVLKEKLPPAGASE